MMFAVRREEEIDVDVVSFYELEVIENYESMSRLMDPSKKPNTASWFISGSLSHVRFRYGEPSLNCVRIPLGFVGYFVGDDGFIAIIHLRICNENSSHMSEPNCFHVRRYSYIVAFEINLSLGGASLHCVCNHAGFDFLWLLKLTYMLAWNYLIIFAASADFISVGVYLNADMEAFFRALVLKTYLPVSASCLAGAFTIDSCLQPWRWSWLALLSCYILANLSQPFSRCDEGGDPRKKVASNYTCSHGVCFGSSVNSVKADIGRILAE
ncbi:hypothetical protein Tco_1503370 [Tanacetum coccineum]